MKSTFDQKGGARLFIGTLRRAKNEVGGELVREWRKGEISKPRLIRQTITRVFRILASSWPVSGKLFSRNRTGMEKLAREQDLGRK